MFFFNIIVNTTSTVRPAVYPSHESMDWDRSEFRTDHI